MYGLHIQLEHLGLERFIVARIGQRLLAAVRDLSTVVRERSYTTPEGFLLLPDDEPLIAHIRHITAWRNDNKLAGIILVGIGGSSLAAHAVISALGASREVIYADAADPHALMRTTGRIKTATAREQYYGVVIVSKTGITLETIANIGVIFDVIREHDPAWREHMIAVTHLGSPLWEWARTMNINHSAMSPSVSGRYSLFSAAGLVPLMLAGIDIEGLLEGAREAQALCLSTGDVTQNPAVIGAVGAYEHLNTGRAIHNLFIFSRNLLGVGQWWRQLIGEGLGKNGKGIAPYVSLGSQDLHSVGQLYLDGPSNFFTTFIHQVESDSRLHISGEHDIASLVGTLGGRPVGDVGNAIYEGAKAAYRARSVPYGEILFDPLSPQSLGAFMTITMIQTVLLARLIGVNPFDQPAVEQYKQEAHNFLDHQKK